MNDGYETYHNNRSQRAKDLIDPLNKISYADIKRIKFDRSLPTKILFPYGFTADSMFLVDENNYPALANIITTLKKWDHAAVAESKGAAIYNIAYYLVPQIMEGRKNDHLTLQEAITVYQKIDDYLKKHFGFWRTLMPFLAIVLIEPLSRSVLSVLRLSFLDFKEIFQAYKLFYMWLIQQLRY